jgi:hypothetical protein
LPRRFPSAATRYARRCPIPSPRSSIATELAVGICTADRDPYKSLASDAAGDVSTGGGYLTVRHGKRRALRRFAGPRPGHNRHTPKPIIGRLGTGGSCDEGGRGGQEGATKYGTNAIIAHESSSPICVMTRLIRGQCVQSLLRRGNTESSLWNQTFERIIGSRSGTAILCGFSIFHVACTHGRSAGLKMCRRGVGCFIPKGSAPWSQTARPGAGPAGFCGFWRNR